MTREFTYLEAWKRALDGKIALLRDKSMWHPAWLRKLGVNMNFGQFLGVICVKNLRESGISSFPWRAPFTFYFLNLLVLDSGYILQVNRSLKSEHHIKTDCN